MKKVLIGMLLLVSVMTYAQHTLIYTHEDRLFEQGRDFFNQQKYAASSRSFEEFLKQADKTKAGQIHEAEYYLVANAFELRQENALKELLDFLRKHPYTTFSDNVHMMTGILHFEQKKYSESLFFFGRVNQFRLNARERAEFNFCRAYAMLETGAYERALPIFRQLRMQTSPFKIDASYYYAYTNYLMKNFSAALAEFLKIENEEKFSEKIAYYIVQIHYHLGNYDELNRRADLLLAQFPNHPNNAEIFRIRGKMAYAAGNFAQAVEFLRRYEAMATDFLRNDFYLMGISLVRLQRYNTAIPYLQRVTTESDALSENAYMHLGHAFLRSGDKVNARLAFEAALNTNFDPRVREDALLNFALATYETIAAFGESIAAFEQFLNEFPNSRHADNVKNYLANEYMSTKNFELAYQSIRRISNPNARMLEALQYVLYQLGTEAFARNDFRQALNFFTSSIQNAPTGKFAADSFYWRSESHYRLGDMESSVRDLQTFLRSANVRNNVNFTIAHYSMGYALFNQRNFSEARRFFEMYTSMERNTRSELFADALSRIGDCFFYERDFRNAEIHYARAANLSPNTTDYALFQSAYTAGLQRNFTTKISRLNALVETFPNSEHADNALYEIGRAHLMLNNNNEAVASYRRLISTFPNSELARKAALEIGMVFLNQERLNDALTAFKAVIANYTGTPEALSALEIMENIYIEMNNVPAYLAYLRSVNLTVPGATTNREDSISFIAAERQYMNSNFREAIAGFRAYLTNFCPGGRYCTTAQFYLADSHYRLNDFNNALIEFDKLLNIQGNQHLEEAAMRCAEISFNQKNFAASLRYFQRFEQLAQTNERRNLARLGVLRSSYQLQDFTTTVSIATSIIGDPRSGNDVIAEARYNRAKAYFATRNPSLALEDVRILSADTRTLQGAEAKFMLAMIHFEQGNLTAAEREVLDFAQRGTPHQYWLARSFILLSDIYIRQGNDFQARQYLLSLQRNYTVQDDIQGMITSRLNDISTRERANIIR